MDVTAFDNRKMEAYAKQSKEQWGDTAAYREYQEKAAGRTPERERETGEQLMATIGAFGQWRGREPSLPEAQAQVKKLQEFITAHYYHCTDEILSGLGRMYAAGGEFTANIDACGGEGTAEFAGRAIAVYCGKQSG